MHSADGWDGVLKPVVERYRGKVSPIYFLELVEAQRIVTVSSAFIQGIPLREKAMRRLLAIAMTGTLFVLSLPAKADVLNLDCVYIQTPPPNFPAHESFWIDFDHKTITSATIQNGTRQINVSSLRSSPVEISPTTFHFVADGGSVVIDRTSGLFTFSGVAKRTCSKSNLARPPASATKF